MDITPYPDEMFEIAEKREAENKALEALDKLYDENSEGMKKLAEAEENPTLPNLKEQALTALYAIATGANDTREQMQDLETIREALEQLP